MAVTFPTRPAPEHAIHGTPEHAEHCCCEPHPWPVIDSDTCLRCGRHSAQTIAQTWADRARLLAKGRKR